MAIGTAIAIAGLALSAAGSLSARSAASKRSKGLNAVNAQIVDNSKEQEELRRKEVAIRANRDRRKAIARFFSEQGAGINRLAGAGAISSSATGGVKASAANTAASDLGGISQAQTVAGQFFDLNEAQAELTGQRNQVEADFQSSSSSAQALSSFGSQLFTNSKKIGQVGTSLFGTT